MGCLQVSMQLNEMIRFAGMVNPGYDIYKRLGLKNGMPISSQDAAYRIVLDMVNDGLFVNFVEALIEVRDKGFMGRKLSLAGLNNVIAGLLSEGYSFDHVSGRFFENQDERITPNWGRLLEGDERKMAVLWIDIVGNSKLVKENPVSEVEKAYDDIRSIASRVINTRIGRLWSWEGDGGLAAFAFGQIALSAVYSGIDLLHELFLYNRLHNPLPSPINVRLGAHIGTVRYSESDTQRKNNDTVKQAKSFEAMAKTNALCIPFNLYIGMDANTLNLFGGEKTGRHGKYRLYSVDVGK
ncbi:MAG: hypothetical protein LBG93_08105 [Treponema sp.]|nr:hypothetical protein [Treponema sp.]